MLMAALVVVSCEKEKNSNDGLKDISFNATINASLDYDVKSTKAGNSKFAPGTHNMGIWICNPHNYSPILAEFENCRAEYTIDDEANEKWVFYGNNRTWDDYLSIDNGRAVQIVSYYPWNENVTDLTSVPFSGRDADIFWCEPISLSEDDTRGNGVLNVNLNYKRIATCIEVAVLANKNDAIYLSQITLTDKNGANFITSGTFNATTGEITPSDNGKLENIVITSDKLLTNDNTTPRFQFVFPEYKGYNGNFELSFLFNKVNGTDGVEGLTKFTIPKTIAGTETENVTLEKGKKYIVTLQMNEEMKFKVLGFKTVDDWNNTPVITDIVM